MCRVYCICYCQCSTTNCWITRWYRTKEITIAISITITTCCFISIKSSILSKIHCNYRSTSSNWLRYRNHSWSKFTSWCPCCTCSCFTCTRSRITCRPSTYCLECSIFTNIKSSIIHVNSNTHNITIRTSWATICSNITSIFIYFICSIIIRNISRIIKISINKSVHIRVHNTHSRRIIWCTSSSIYSIFKIPFTRCRSFMSTRSWCISTTNITMC